VRVYGGRFNPTSGRVVVLPRATRDMGLVHAYATYCRSVNRLVLGGSVTFYWEGYSPWEGESHKDHFVKVVRTPAQYEYSDLSNTKRRELDQIWDILVVLLRDISGNVFEAGEPDGPNNVYDVDSYL